MAKHTPKQTHHFCFSTWGAEHTTKRTPETDLRIIPLRQTSRFGNVILRHNHVQGSGKYIQAAPISLFFFLIAWGRLGKFAPDFLHFCVESSESRKVLGVGQRQILLAATWITSNDGSSLVGLRRRPWFCMATVQCRPCTPKVNRPPPTHWWMFRLRLGPFSTNHAVWLPLCTQLESSRWCKHAERERERCENASCPAATWVPRSSKNCWHCYSSLGNAEDVVPGDCLQTSGNCW